MSEKKAAIGIEIALVVCKTNKQELKKNFQE
jgi:hypothetical protein